MSEENRSASASAGQTTTGTVDLTALARQVEQIGRENQRLFQQLVAGEKRFRGLAKAVWRVQEAERRRLAMELHDGLGQTLTALKIQLERLATEAGDEHPGWASKLAGAADLAGRSVEETRRLSHLLRPQILDDLGLIPALRWFARTLGEWTGFAVRLEELPAGGERFEPDVETLIFRVAQEALNNALKHSGADGAELRLRRRSQRLELQIEDDGCGFDPEVRSTGGSGLSGLRDRVTVFGGRLRIRSRPGEGTVIHVSVPLAGEPESADDLEGRRR